MAAAVQVEPMTAGDDLVQQGRAAVSRLLLESGPDAPLTLEARCALGRALTLNHEYVEAKEVLEDVLDRQRNVLSEIDDHVLRTELWLAAVHFQKREFESARILQHHVVTNSYLEFDDFEWPLNPGIADLARTLFCLGDHINELPLRRRVVASYLEHLAPDDIRVLEARGDLAVALRATGDVDGAYAIDRDLVGDMERSGSRAQFLGVKFHLSIDLFLMGHEKDGLALANEAYSEMLAELMPDDPIRMRTEEHLKTQGSRLRYEISRLAKGVNRRG
jgi:tetratricopeptide (TPR) repeat protein